MADKILNVRIQAKYDTEANWKAKDPVLLKGEQAFSSDVNNKYKVGNGTSKWSALSYAKADLSKGDVTTALGYTPPTSNTWRGIQNNLTSDSTTDSLSAAQGKVLKGLVDGKAASSHIHDDRYYTETEINTKLSGKSDTGHKHTISDVTNLQSTLDGKASSSHTHNYAGSNSAGGTANASYKLSNVGQITTVDALNNFNEASIFKYATMAALDGLDGLAKNDGIILSAPWSSASYGHQIFLDDNGYTIAHRYRSNGTWSSWKTLIDSSKIGSQSVSYASSAGSATQLSTSDGSATQPVYFSSGKPVACTYTLGKSVPSNAVFTDTNTWIAFKGATTSAAGTAGYAPAPSAGAANRYLRSDGTWAVPPDTNTVYTHPSSGVTAGTYRSVTVNAQGHVTAGSNPTTLAGYGITDAVSSSDSRLTNARPASDVYTWAKASTKPTYTKSEVGLGNVDNTADSTKNVAMATKLQTYKNGSTTETYGTQYPLFAQWDSTGKIVNLVCTGYTVKIGSASVADSANAVAWTNVSGKPSSFTPASHTHSYAGSSSAGGSATSAVKLDTSTAGSATQPVYFTGGKPTACTYTLGKSVPSNAVFTDTTYSVFTAASATSSGSKGLVPAPAAGKQDAYLKGDGTWAIPSSSGLPLDGSGTMTGAVVSSVSSNSYLNANKGVAIINSTAGRDNFVALAKMNGSDGIFTTGVFKSNYFLYYTVRTDVANSKNNFTYGATLLNSSGNTTFPGIVTAKSYANTSDIRLKKNVSDTQITDALSIINKMKLRQFDWKADSKHQAIGFIADELQKLDENLVTGGGNDQDGNIIPKAIDSFYLLSYVVKGVQELSREVSGLKAENELLKQKLNM